MSNQDFYAFINPQDLMLNHTQRMVPNQPQSPPTYIAPPQFVPRPLHCVPLSSSAVTPQLVLDAHRDDRLSELRLHEHQWVPLPRPPQFTGYLDSNSITFSSGGVPGVRLRDVYHGALIDGPHDQVFASHGWRKMCWLIHWPGYEVSYKAQSISVFDDRGMPLSRLQLAQIISGEIHYFMKRAGAGKYPSYQQTPGNSRWTIGKGKITFDDVRLVALHHFKTMFVTELHVRA